MKKAEFLRKLDEVNVLIAKGRYQEAVEEADELDLDMLSDPRKLQKIAKAYEKCKRYIDAEDLLEQAYEYAPKSRGILFHLCTVSVKAGEVSQARQYMEAFEKAAPYDVQRHVLRYRVAVAEKATTSQIINILEEYRQEEPDDRWMYVLAEAYAASGDTEKAVEVCDDIELWFNGGKYYDQAMMLRAKLGGSGIDFDELMKYAEPEEEPETPAEVPEVVASEEELPEEFESTPEELFEEVPEEDVQEEEEIVEETVEETVILPEEEPEDPNTYQMPEDFFFEDEEEETPEAAPVEEPEEVAEPEEELPEFSLEMPEEEQEEEAPAETEEPTYVNTIYSVPRPMNTYASQTEDEEDFALPEDMEVPVIENEMESDTEGAKALQEKTEKSLDPAEWSHIIFDDDVEEAESEIEVPEDALDEHVVVSVKSEAFDKLNEIEFDWAEEEPEEAPAEEPEEKTVASETPAEEVTGKEPEFQFEGFDIEAEAVAEEKPIEKDLLDMVFSEEGATAVDQELAKRKSERAKFGNIPMAPDASEGLWHFIVYGKEKSLQLECAKEQIREIGDNNDNCPEKILKVSAARIAEASIVNSLDRFLGNIVIIEDCAALSEAQLRDFTKILDKDDRSLLVIFTDTKENIIEMLKREPKLAECFTGIFEGKRYTPEDLVKEAKDYLFTEAAKLSADGEKCVYEEGRRLLSEQTGYYRSDILEYVSKALAIADKGGFLGLMGGKCDKEGYLIVSEKHFKKINK